MAGFGFDFNALDIGNALAGFNQMDLQNAPQGGGWFQKLGSMYKNNPEMFQIMGDMLGRGFAPDNPFAGIGTAMGQSSLANKALQEQRQGQLDTRNMLASLFSGGLTPQGVAGPTSMTLKPGKPDGEGNIGSDEMTFNLTQPRETGSGSKPRYMDMSSMFYGPNAPF